MTTLTLDQQSALDFYSEYVNQVQYFGLTILADREERLLFRQGKKLVEEALETAKKGSKGYVSWTAEEYDSLALAYVNFAGDRPAIIKEFRKSSDRHSDNAIDIAAQACRHLDKTVKTANGLKDHADGLLLALQSIDSNRF